MNENENEMKNTYIYCWLILNETEDEFKQHQIHKTTVFPQY